MLKSGDFAPKFNMEMMYMYIKRDRYLNQLISRKENGLIKVITGAYVKIGLNQEKPYKTRV